MGTCQQKTVAVEDTSLQKVYPRFELGLPETLLQIKIRSDNHYTNKPFLLSLVRYLVRASNYNVCSVLRA